MSKPNGEAYYEVSLGYEIPLKVIREAVTSVVASSEMGDLHDSIIKDGAAIGFFRCESEEEEEEDRMRMRIFPFSDKTLKQNLLDEGFIRTITRAICRKKRYSDFDHLEHFRKHYNSDKGEDLYLIDFSPDDIIEFCPVKRTVTIGEDTVKWSLLKRNLERGQSKYYDQYRKQLDHLLFASGMEGVYILPIPILSSPSVLLFFNKATFNDHFGKQTNQILKLIQRLISKVSDALFFHLYNRMLIEFTEEDDSDLQLQQQPDKESLLNQFVHSIANIMLPTRYKIDDQPWVDFFHWFEPDEHLQLQQIQIILHPNRTDPNVRTPFYHTVTFELPNYQVPCSKGASVEWVMRAAKDEMGKFHFREYLEQEEKFKITLQNLYRMIFDYWRAIRESKDFIKNKVEPQLVGLEEMLEQLSIQNIKSFRRTMESLKESIAVLAKGEITRKDGFYPVGVKGDKTVYKVVFRNKVAKTTFDYTDVHRLYDLISSNEPLDEKQTYVEFKLGRADRRKAEVPSVDSLYDEFKKNEEDAKSLEVGLIKARKEGSLDLKEESNRKMIFLYLGHRKVLKQISNDINLYHSQTRFYKPSEELGLKLENVEKIVQEHYQDDYENFRSEPRNKMLFQRVSQGYSPNTPLNEYNKAIRRAIERIAQSFNGPEQGELLELFKEAGLIGSYSVGKDRSVQITPIRNAPQNFDQSKFSNWEFKSPAEE